MASKSICVRIPNFLLEEQYRRAAERVLAGQLGRGRNQEPSANLVFVESIARYLNVELPETADGWKKGSPDDMVPMVIRPRESLHQALLALKTATQKSINALVIDCEKIAIHDFEMNQHQVSQYGRVIVATRVGPLPGDPLKPTMVKLPAYMRDSLYRRAAARTLLGERGIGKGEELSAHHVLIEDLARFVNINLGTEEWVKPDPTEYGMTQLRLPPVLQEALQARKALTGMPINSIVIFAITANQY